MQHRVYAHTVKPIYTDIRYNDKTLHNDSPIGVSLQSKMRRTVEDIQEQCI